MLSCLLFGLLLGYIMGVLACRSHYQFQYKNRIDRLQQIIDTLIKNQGNPNP